MKTLIDLKAAVAANKEQARVAIDSFKAKISSMDEEIERLTKELEETTKALKEMIDAILASGGDAD